MNSEGFPIPGHDLSICAGGSVTLVRIEQCELFRGGCLRGHRNMSSVGNLVSVYIAIRRTAD